MVYGQQAEDSCGIACMLMVNFKLKKWQLAGAAAAAPSGVFAFANAAVAFESAVKSEPEVYAAYSKVSGQPYKGDTYTYATILPGVLNNLDIGTWSARCVASNKVADTILDRSFMGPPFIILVHWRSGAGHFVMCDNIVQDKAGTTAYICDPWDAAVRSVTLRRGQPLTYQAQEQAGWDLGQARKKYGAPSTGAMDGWLVYRTGGG